MVDQESSPEEEEENVENEVDLAELKPGPRYMCSSLKPSSRKENLNFQREIIALMLLKLRKFLIYC